jgi:hypothetical protein
MSKRAEEAQASAILPESIISYAKEHAVLSGLVYREGVKYGYEQAEKDIISIIESRLSELHGDAQPTPILRYELMDLVEKIKED